MEAADHADDPTDLRIEAADHADDPAYSPPTIAWRPPTIAWRPPTIAWRPPTTPALPAPSRNRAALALTPAPFSRSLVQFGDHRPQFSLTAAHFWPSLVYFSLTGPVFLALLTPAKSTFAAQRGQSSTLAAVSATISRMAQPSPPRHRYSYAEYLTYEQDSGLKHEYCDGEILAMAGGSRRHNALALRVGAALDAGRESGCVAFQSDQKVRVLATGRATYPDATVVSGQIEGDPADPQGATITNPTVLVEVLSPSTEQEDRGGKWQHYQLIQSLKEYVLVSQSPARVERYRRIADDKWEYSEVREGTLQLCTGALLDLHALYEGLPD